MSALPDTEAEVSSFVHEAMVYRDDDEFVTGTLRFVHSALAAGEPVLVAVPGRKIPSLSTPLGPLADQVRFVDMSVAGRNPGRIIPEVLGAFADEHPGRRVALVGEPIWPDRTDEEYPACLEHEALINVAFDGRPMTVFCPYDGARLSERALADAERTHPVMVHRGARMPSTAYDDPAAVASDAAGAPPPVPPGAESLGFDLADLPVVRQAVRRFAATAALAEERIEDLQLAVNEIATNSLAHTSSTGRLRMWRSDRSIVCEVSDNGRITDPMVGRRPAARGAEGGRGLLIVHHLCDLVQVFRQTSGTAVRMHMHL